jgi:spore coat polysaccharide biosynthesis protein SpsF
MKVGYLIIGRLKSTRLQKKILLPVEGRPFLEHMFDHIRLSKRTNVVVLCTSTNPEDDPLEMCAKNNGIECFRGDEDDVVKRLYDASVKYGLDYILTITADCPLVDPDYADKVVEAYEKTNADLITAMDLPHGAFTHGMKPAALRKILEIKDTKDSEVWGRYFSDTGLFETYRMPIVNPKHKRPNIRMTLDYPQDYEFFKALFAALYQKGKVFTLDEIIDYLDAHPEIMEINKNCAQLYLNRYTRQSEIKLKKRFDPKKVVIFGSGSIGQRHISNLQKLGVSDIVAFRTKLGHHQALPQELNVKEVTDWKQVTDFKPDVAIITNPTSLHVETAIRVAPLVKGILIEKPLSNSLQGIQQLEELVQSKQVVTFVGYNLQLHPIVSSIMQQMDKDHLGKPLVFQAQVGQWLPDWHPYEDYKKGYAAQKELGGGVTLTLIHEINLAQKILGPAKKVAAFFPVSERLSLDVDTIADIMIYHEKGTVSQIHLDYIQRPNSRFGSIAFEQGRLQYDFGSFKLEERAISASDPQIIWQNKDDNWDEMYQAELELFLRYTAEGRMKHDFDLWHAQHDLHIVEAAFESAKSGRIVEIKQ